ncbi:MAG TPA: GNAT family N-acetyltransferase [Gaiellaceae bacterium]|jgi:predicted GNAT family acetyltransferase|nr:GNAT family N-acetyltransferase [Gaiellaceae bacterium]
MAQVTDNESANRFELRLDGRLGGWIDYDRQDGTVALTHAEVVPELRNRGHGETMVREALADLKRRDLQARAICPFVQAYVRRHPDAI